MTLGIGFGDDGQKLARPGAGERREEPARAIVGEEYVVYAALGGPVKLNLAAGRYMALLFNPRTGEERPLPRVTGGAKHNFNLPQAEDWVLHLRNEKK